MDTKQINLMLRKLDDWQHVNGVIQKSFQFNDYQTNMFFINAISWVSHKHNHHPEITVGYNFCTIKYSTHEIGGLSERDFNCALKVDSLFNI